MAQVLAERTTKQKKSVAVAMRQPKKKQKKKKTDGMFGLFATQDDQHTGGAQEGEEEAPRPRQKDPLRNKIRESIPEVNLRKVMLWFLLAEIDPEYGQHPRNIGLCDASHYMRVQVKDSTATTPTAATAATAPPLHMRRYTPAATQPPLRHRCYTTAATPPPLTRRYTTTATPPTPLPLTPPPSTTQARVLTCMELWAISRGDDVRGNSDAMMSVGKLFGSYVSTDIIGPDRLYRVQLLKDSSKNNRVGRPEIIGIGRHKIALLCGINAIITMLILRFGRGGLIGQLPDFFDPYLLWSCLNCLLTRPDGKGMMDYDHSKDFPEVVNSHVQLFAQMKTAAGLEGIMADTATKLRSFGAMNASDNQASHAEIERSGR